MQLPTSRATSPIKLSYADAAAAILAPFAARLLRDLDAYAVQEIGFYAAVTAATSLISLAYFRVGGILGDYLCTADVRRIGKAALVGVLAGVLVIFTVNRLDQIPRSIPILHIAVLIALPIGWRLVTARRRFARSRRFRMSRHAAGDGAESVLLIGANEMALLYIRMLAIITTRRPRVVALLDEDKRLYGHTIAGHQVIGGWSSLRQIVAEYMIHGVRIDRVIVMISDPDEIQRVAREIAPICSELEIEFDLWTDRVQQICAPAQTKHHPALASDQDLAIRNPAYWGLRRAVDVLGSLAALVVLSPVLVLAAIVVACDVGLPVIFWQDRVGRYGRPFRMYKFRTLQVPYGSHDVPLRDEQRLSAIGRWLRATRLDELPQLLNILWGDMTMIGPRPLLPIDQPSNDLARLAVRPGLTGWAQVNGGKLITPEEKNMLDKWYVRNCGPMLDLRIIALTSVAVFRGDSLRAFTARTGMTIKHGH